MEKKKKIELKITLIPSLKFKSYLSQLSECVEKTDPSLMPNHSRAVES